MNRVQTLLQTPVVYRVQPDFTVFDRGEDEQEKGTDVEKEIEQLRGEITLQTEKIAAMSAKLVRQLDTEEDLQNLKEQPLTEGEGGARLQEEIQALGRTLWSPEQFDAAKKALETRKMILEATTVQLRARVLSFDSEKKKRKGEHVQNGGVRQKGNDSITQKLIVSNVTTLQTLKVEHVMTAAGWIRRWRLSLLQTGQNAWQKCTATRLKLDPNLKSMFDQIMKQGEIQWVAKHQTTENENYDVYTNNCGQQFKVKKGSVYAPDFDLFLDALLKKMLWSTPERSILDAISRQTFVMGTDVTVHSEKVVDLLTTLESKKPDLSDSEKARLYLQTMPSQWIAFHNVPQDPTLDDAIQWAITVAAKKINDQKFLRDSGVEEVNALMGEKFMFPSQQSVETSTTKTTRKEYNTADTGKFKSLMMAKNELEKRQQKEADESSDSEEEARQEPKKSDKKSTRAKRKRKGSEMVTTEDIHSILDDRFCQQSEQINAVMQTFQKNFNRKATCSHCKYEDCFESEKPILKRGWEQFVKTGEVIEGHYAGNCEKKANNKHFKKHGLWCGKCKSYEHAYRVHAGEGFQGDRNNLNRRGS